MIKALLACVLCFLLSQPLALGQAEPNGWDQLEARAHSEYGELGSRAASFLREHAPPSDAELDDELLWNNLDLALRARSEFPWSASVPEEMFFNDVLPYAVFDETREDWRPRCYELCSEIVKDAADATEAIQLLNRDVFNALDVHYNTGRKSPNQSPQESIDQGRATCTGLSIILAYACRSVGIPARAAGVENWHDLRGNHTWVEAWDGEWRYTGADEYIDKGLDHAWFTGDAARATPGHRGKAVWATSWAHTGEPFPMVWSPRSQAVSGVDVTRRYTKQPIEPRVADAVALQLRAWDGEQRIAARVRLTDITGTEVADVFTRGGRADFNDMPIAVIRAEQPHTLTVEHRGKRWTTQIEPLDAADGAQTRDLRLSEMQAVLSKQEAHEAIEAAWAGIADGIKAEHEGELIGEVTAAGQTMRLLERTFGDAPAGERSLWISLHGGGGAPAEVNDRQWRNQIKLYEPAEGLYIAPRAPTDTWNLWHQPHIDVLLDELISVCVATRGVDPNRVYLMGYSAGGDGVYQLAPRQADRFAAAAMMAGHPNDARPESLRNLPFAIFMGGKDAAYKRNEVAADWGHKLGELQSADHEGYPHRVTIFREHAHWMNGEDREALPWMRAHTRNPWPSKIVWRQDDVTHTRLYWLERLDDAIETGEMITAAVEGQTITLESDDVRAVRLLLRDQIIDLDQPIVVIANGTKVFHGRVYRTNAEIERSLTARRDPTMTATASLEASW